MLMKNEIIRQEESAMKNKLISGVFALSMVLLLIIACAKPPTEEIEAAESALARAEADADAREYAPESLVRAQNLVDRMRAAVDAEDYDLARNLAQDAVAAAGKAITDGAAAKETARNNASAAISGAKSLFTEVENSLSGAKNVSGISLDISAIEKDISAAAQIISAAENDFANADYATAQSKAKDAQSALADIQRYIADAVQKVTRRK